MATHPDDQHQPDSHEGQAPEHRKTDPAMPGSGSAAERRIDSDSTIDLGQPAPGAGDPNAPQAEMSGISAIDWGALVEEPESGDVKVDSPSDADLRATMEAEAAAQAPPPAAPSLRPPTHAHLDLGRQPKTDPQMKPARAPVTDVNINLGRAAATQANIDLGRGPVTDANINLGQAPATDANIDLGRAPATDANINLGRATPTQANINLGRAPATQANLNLGTAPETQASIDLGRSPPTDAQINLGQRPKTQMMGDKDIFADDPTRRPRRPVTQADFPGEIFDAPAADLGKVELAGEVPEPGHGHSSGIDLGAYYAPGEDQSAQILHGPGGPADSGSGVDLAKRGFAGPEDSADSASDFLANSGESGVDLGKELEAAREGSSTVNVGEGEALDLAEEADAAQSSEVNLGGRPPTQILGPEVGGRPPTQAATFDLSGRPPTQFATSDEMAAQFEAASDFEPGQGPSDSEVDLGSQVAPPDAFPSSGHPPAKTASDSDIDIDVGVSPEAAAAAGGSGLLVNAASGRLEPTAIDIGAEDYPAPPQAADAKEAAKAKPAPAPKKAAPRIPVGTGGSLIGRFAGPVVGVFVGAAGAFGLQFAGYGIPTNPPPKTGSGNGVPTPNPNPNPPPIAAGPTVSKVDWLKSGDLTKAADAGIDKIDESKTEQLAQRGEYRWLSYLQKQRQAQAPIKAEDDGAKQAAADLQAAADKGDADALFWLGHLQESTNALDQAKATYVQGAQKATDPVTKRRFEAALHRLELRSDKPAGAVRGLDAGEALLLAVVALQAGAPAAAPATDEAGFEFWQAAKLAREQKYAEALAALDKARMLHDQLRFIRLRKAQNPLSDPTEEVFLRCADELKAYWQLQEKLKTGGYLDVAERRDPAKAIDELVAKSKSGGEGMKALAEKLVKEKVIAKPEDLGAGIDALVKDRTKAAEDVVKLEKKLTEAATATKQAREEAAAMTEKAKASEDEIKNATAKLKAATDREKELAAAKAAAEAAQAVADGELKKVADELVKAKLLDPKAGKGAILEGVQAAVKTAAASDREGAMRALQAELASVREQLKQRRTTLEAPAVLDPAQGERLYDVGLFFYHRGQFEAAEKALLAAIEQDGQDARYHYFLGLTREQQGKREAQDDFQLAVQLEQRGLPGRAAVSSALERVQGPPRRSLNAIRNKP